MLPDFIAFLISIFQWLLYMSYAFHACYFSCISFTITVLVFEAADQWVPYSADSSVCAIFSIAEFADTCTCLLQFISCTFCLLTLLRVLDEKVGALQSCRSLPPHAFKGLRWQQLMLSLLSASNDYRLQTSSRCYATGFIPRHDLHPTCSWLLYKTWFIIMYIMSNELLLWITVDTLLTWILCSLCITKIFTSAFALHLSCCFACGNVSLVSSIFFLVLLSLSLQHNLASCFSFKFIVDSLLFIVMPFAIVDFFFFRKNL